MIELSELNLFDAPAFAGLSLAEHRAGLLAIDGQEGLAIGATEGERPIGLVYAQQTQPFILEAQSLFVVPSHRGQGIANRLLEVLEAAAARAGHRRIDLQYRRVGATLAAWERVLGRRGFQAFSEGAIFSYWVKSQVLEWSAMGQARLDDRYELVPWGEVGDAARAQLSGQNWFPAHLNPLAHEASCEPTISFALRFEDRIVGWCLTRRIDATCLDYRNIYVHESHNLMRNGSFATLALFAEAMRRQIAIDGEAATGRLDVSETNKKLRLVIANYVAPYLIEQTESRRLYKQLA